MYKQLKGWREGLTQRLRTLVCLVEIPGLDPSTHLVAHDYLELQVQGTQRHLLAFLGTHKQCRPSKAGTST